MSLTPGTPVEQPELSPNGGWVVYTSDESGPQDLYAVPYPVGARRRITTEGGLAPVWVRDRPELIFEAGDDTGRLGAIEITTQPELRRANPTILLSQEAAGTQLEWSRRRNFDVTADGERFLVVLPVDAAGSGDDGVESSRIDIVVNWHQDLLERVPVDQAAWWRFCR